MAREALLPGQTLKELLDGRNLVATFGVLPEVPEGMPGQAPSQPPTISVRILYEVAVPLSETPLVDELPFEDVQSYDWFQNPVVWAFQNGIMSGISASEFAPSAEMTRAMLVTVLWRYAGMPDAGETAFADVTSDTWYSTAIAWATTNGIVMGYDETTFGVNDFVTREQMYTILYRYMNFAGLTIVLEDELRLRQFADEDEISDWAKEALFFMYDAGVMFRLSTLDFYARPQENAFRGEIAGAMYFFDMYAVLLDSGQTPNDEPSFKVGSVALIANGIEHEPHIHLEHAAIFTDSGLMSASGIPFLGWLEENLSTMPKIQYTADLKIIVDDQDGRIGSPGNVPEYYDGMRLIPISAGSFLDGRADVSLPDAPGVYLLLVDVIWSGGGEEFTSLRYVFKIAK